MSLIDRLKMSSSEYAEYYREKVADCSKTIMLVVGRESVSKASQQEIIHALISRGFYAIVLSVHRTDGIPVELFDLSALEPAERDAVAKVVEEHTGKSI